MDAAADAPQVMPCRLTKQATLAMSQRIPIALAVDDQHVYWLDDYDDVWRVPKNGGEPQSILPSSAFGGGDSMALDTTDVYASQNQVVVRVSKTTSTPFTVLDADSTFNNHGIALSATDVYVAGAFGAIAVVSKAGGKTRWLSGGIDGRTLEVAVDAENAFVTTFPAPLPEGPPIGKEGLWRAPLGGGAAVMITHISSSRPLVLDGPNVYVVTDFGVWQVEKASGKTTQAASTTTWETRNVAVDAKDLYWAANGAVQRVAKNGGMPAAVVTGLFSPKLVAVDETCVYWVDSLDDSKEARIAGAPK
jgi:hypothetical protein